MKKYTNRYIKSDENSGNTITVTMYLQPIVYYDSKISAAVYIDEKGHYHTDVDLERIIDGPLSVKGQELENPVKKEFDEFKEDCVFLIKELGFTIIKQKTSTDSKKSEYILVFGIDDKPCGTLVYDIRISDHTIKELKFPEELKNEALEYLKMNHVVSGIAEKAGIDFSVKEIIVSGVKHDTWDRAFNRLYSLLKLLRKKVQIRLNSRK